MRFFSVRSVKEACLTRNISDPLLNLSPLYVRNTFYANLTIFLHGSDISAILVTFHKAGVRSAKEHCLTWNISDLLTHYPGPAVRVHCPLFPFGRRKTYFCESFEIGKTVLFWNKILFWNLNRTLSLEYASNQIVPISIKTFNFQCIFFSEFNSIL